ncbi:DUF1616 domain-containing protein [Halorussus lipolyticus]|uniref:DUF1616 domain-containing protein n=1 Tax=Halorussus lipolyticus TaxID=3034024 RepID=UPI0023E7A9AE|nr:DUF1616 domain-containing protein [Halorussus sp. DT80]
MKSNAEPNGETDPDSGTLARRVPLDLLATVALALVAAAALLALPTRAPLTDLLGASAGALTARLVTLALGLPLLLFLPGYAAVAVLFPGREPDVERLDAEGNPVAPRFQFRERERIDDPARVTLAIGVSAVVTPVTALAVNFTPWGLYARPLVVALAGVVVVGSLVAAVVRLRLPPEDRFAPTLRPASSALSSGDSDLGAANLVLAVGVLVAVAGIGFAVAVPKPGAQFTELYLLSEDENGTLVADDYPEFAADDPEPLVVAVENHEGRDVTYSLVVEHQRVEPGGSAVVNETQLARTEIAVASGERELTRFDLSPETGPDSRLRVLVYRGPVPADPTAESAYRHVVLWLGDGSENATATGTTRSPATGPNT